VAGDRRLFDSLQEHIFSLTPKLGIFLAILARHALSYDVPLGLFRRFVVEHKGEHRDMLDLKGAGAMPLTDLLRVHALAHGIRAAGSLQRIEALRMAGKLQPTDAAELTAAFRLVLRLRLQHQADQLAAGHDADNWIKPSQLSRQDRDALRDAFLVIRQSQSALGNEYGVQ